MVCHNSSHAIKNLHLATTCFMAWGLMIHYLKGLFIVYTNIFGLHFITKIYSKEEIKPYFVRLIKFYTDNVETFQIMCLKPLLAIEEFWGYNCHSKVFNMRTNFFRCSLSFHKLRLTYCL